MSNTSTRWPGKLPTRAATHIRVTSSLTRWLSGSAKSSAVNFTDPKAGSRAETIRQDDPSKVIVRLHVNDVFPEGIPLTTTPPTLLLKLPELPQELAYRFVGHDLTLIDTKARLIVDLIPNAIP